MKKRFEKCITCIFLMLFVAFNTALAQKPFISGLDKTSGTVNEEVTISGLNLPTGAALQVNFGAAKAASIVSASANLIVATVPAGATYGPISVTNITSGLTGYSSQQFMLSYDGVDFLQTSLGAQQLLPPDDVNQNVQPFDLTMADFNADGLIDIVRTNDRDNNFDIYQNTSVTPVISFTRTVGQTPSATATKSADSGDLDGDGKPDLVLSRGNSGDRFFIFPNTSTAAGAITFGTVQEIILPKIGANIRIARRPIINDLDGDGKPEIVITNETDNITHVYVNQSTVGAISFATTPLELVATGVSVGMSGLDIKDLNNDGFPEVVISAFINSPNFYVFRNISSPGAISFMSVQVVAAPGGFVNNVVGDFDNDGWNDIAATNVGSDVITIVRNQTSEVGGAISFSAALNIPTSTDAPLGLGLGDLNGDGKVDIAVGHEDSSIPRVVALINTTVGSSFTFTAVNIPTTSTSRNVKIGDLDNDGRPDLALTHDILTDVPGDLSVFRNANCITPVIEPGGPLVICTGGSLTLEATKTNGAGYTYAWDKDGVAEATTTSSHTFTGPGTYKVTLTSDGTCSVASTTVVVTVDPEAVVNPTVTGGSACPSTDFQLTSTHPGTPTGYQWTGPDGFTSTDANPTISNIQPNQAGEYSLRVTLGTMGCLSDEITGIVTVTNVPQPSVINTNGVNYCETIPVSISTPIYSGYTYSWERDGVAISGATSTTLTVSGTGGYSAIITDPATSCFLESAADTLKAIAPPVSSFTAIDSICVNLPVDFTATSTGDTLFTLNYAWNFGDAASTTGSLVNEMLTYTTAGDFSPRLTTGYDELANCTNDSVRTVRVKAVPTVVIDVEGEDGTLLTDPFEKCPSDTVSLIIPQTLTSIEWMLSGTTDALDTTSTFSTGVEGTYAATGTDEVGCVINSEVTVSNFAGSGLILDSSSNTIENDSLITLDENQTVVALSVSGGISYEWSPAQIVSDSTSFMVDVIPFDINTVLTVTGLDENQCIELATVTIVNPFILARKTFSPNGDGLGNECWEITNSNSLNGCTVTVFDSRGRRLFEATSPFTEDCVWDGNFNGSAVPEGIYYFAMKCEDNQFNRSGSILLAR